MKIVFLLSLVTSAAFAQIAGPVLGLVPENGTIRPMSGIPAAANVGGALATGAFTLVEPSPSQTFALVTAADTGQVSLVALNSDGSAQSTPVSATASPDKIVFSPNGVSAALWYAADQHLEVLSGLPQSPAVRAVQAATIVNGRLASFAVSDDAQWLALAEGSFVYAVGVNAAPVSLPISGTPEAVAFFHGSSTLAVITNLEVVTFADPGGAATRTQIWSSPTGAPPNPQQAVGFGLSSDNSYLTIAGNLGGVQTFELANNSGTYVNCGCTPTTLVNLGASVFRLTGTESGPVKLYDASTAQILFVPTAAQRLLHQSLGPAIRSGGQTTAGAQTE